MSLSDTTGMDILGFDRKLIKIAGHHIADSLLDIINDSLSNGLFSEDWKLARVIPVFNNNGDVDVMSNYHPISVIGHIAKMVEQLVRTQHVDYLEEHSFITPDHSAYLKGHSTQSSLHRIIDDCLENINETQITGVCLLDIYNAWLGSKVTKSCSTTDKGGIWPYKLSWDLVKSLNLYKIRKKRYHFLLTLMFKAIHGIAPNYLSDWIDMHFDIHGFDTREAGSMNVYLPTLHKEIYKNSSFNIWVANFGMICQILWRTLRI